MSIYRIWIPGEKGYKEHLDRIFIAHDHITAIKEQTNELKSAYRQQSSDQTQKLIASNEQVISALGEGFNRIAEINTQGFNRIAEINERGFTQVTNAIEDLHSDMVYCFGTVIQVLEFQNKLLASILGTLKTPERTKVEELYNEGCLQAKGGLLNYATDYLKKSISHETGHTFFPSHLKLGLLYLFGEGDKTDKINPKDATYYLLKANELGTGLWKANHSYASTLANCKLYLSQSYYGQLNGYDNLSELELLNSAIKYCEEAVSLNSEFSQGFYHIAKYYSYGFSKFGEYKNDNTIEKIISNFKTAVEFDRNYLFAVDSKNTIYYDKAFESCRQPLIDKIKDLTNQKRITANRKLNETQKKILELEQLGITNEIRNDYNKVKEQVIRAKNDFNTETFFGYDDCIINILKS